MAVELINIILISNHDGAISFSHGLLDRNGTYLYERSIFLLVCLEDATYPFLKNKKSKFCLF